jgi:hypothetical protein
MANWGRKKKMAGTPVVVGGVRVRKRTRVRFIFSIFLYRVFELPSSRNAQKRDKQNSRKSRFWIFGRIFCKNFSTRFFLQNVFGSVFELPSLRNTRKRDKTKKVEEKLTSNFLSKFWKKFSTFGMDFLQKYLYSVFELPLPRNAQKRTKKKSQGEKKSDGGWVGLGFSKCAGGVRRFVFAGPSGVRSAAWKGLPVVESLRPTRKSHTHKPLNPV